MKKWKLVSIEIENSNGYKVSKITLWSFVVIINILGFFLTIKNTSKVTAFLFNYIKQIDGLYKMLLIHTIVCSLYFFASLFFDIITLKMVLNTYFSGNLFILIITLIRIIIKI
jgi:hypothetical protein